jgi:hypothetical protein
MMLAHFLVHDSQVKDLFLLDDSMDLLFYSLCYVLFKNGQRTFMIFQLLL